MYVPSSTLPPQVIFLTSNNPRQISNVTMVSIALPIIGRDLSIPSSRLQWLVSAYSLSSGCFLVFFGRIADLYGCKRVFIAGSAWLMVFSIGLTLVNDEITLDVLRGFQGIGAAATIPSSVGILARSFPPSRLRSFAFATFSAGAPVGAAVGTLVGGVLTQLTSQTWRSVFYFAAGLSAAVLALGLFFIDADQPSEETDRRVDWIGAFLITAGLVLIVFVLSDGEIVGWANPYIITLLIVGVLCMVGFVLWERHLEGFHTAYPEDALISRWTPPPLMKPSIWSRARGRFAVAMVIAFLNWSAFLSWLFWVQLYYQDYLGLTPIQSMVRLLPMWVTGVLCNLAVALFIGRLGLAWIVGAFPCSISPSPIASATFGLEAPHPFPHKRNQTEPLTNTPPTAIGTLLTGTASLLFALINPAAPYWAYGFPAAVFSVFGAEFVFASGLIFVAKVSEGGEQSLAGGLFNVMTQVNAVTSVLPFPICIPKESLS